MASEIQNMKNPSLLLYGPGDARYEDREIPKLGDRDVLVKIEYVGVCGSDVHFWHHGGIRAKVSPAHPITMGHEAVGTITAVGPSTTHLRINDRVALEPGLPCRHCSPCKSGFYNLCKDMRFAAAPPDGHGTLTKYFISAEDFCYKIPENVGLKEAVLVEPLAVACHAVKLGDVKVGETVVVMGSGTVGLLCAATARAFGAERVVLCDVLAAKLEFAEAWLKCETFLSSTSLSADENAAKMLEQLGLQDQLVDTVIEASGAENSINTAIHVLRPGGKYVQTGLGKQMITFPIVEMSEKELYVRGCFRYGSGDFEMALGLLRRGIVDVSTFVSGVTEFGRATEAWDKTARGEGIKNLIRGPE